jgi:hypothetical protein
MKIPDNSLLPQIAIAFLFIVVFGIFVAQVLYTPEVHWSTSKDRCVEVIPTRAGDCKSLPEKYELIMVY